MDRKYVCPCSSYAVESLFQGLFIGTAWTAVFKGDFPVNSAGLGSGSLAFRTIWLRNVGCFGGYLAVSRSAACSMEKIRGKKDLMNEFCGGFSGGLIVSISLIDYKRAGTGLARLSAVGQAACIWGFVHTLLHVPSYGGNWSG